MPGARNIVLAESGEILFRVTQNGFDSGGGGAASAHVDEIAGDIGGGCAVFFDETQHNFKIGGGADFRNEGAVLLVAAVAAVEGGVSGHPASLEGAGGIFLAFPSADDLAIRIDEKEVTVNGICFGVLRESISDILQDFIVEVVIIRIKEADDIACGHSDTFVHGVVDSIVLFRNPAHMAPEVLFIVSKHGYSAIGAAAIDHDKLVVCIRLGAHALQRIEEGRCAVEAGCDDADFHGISGADSLGILTGFVATKTAGFGVLGGSGRNRAERIYTLRDALRQCDFPEGEEEDFHVEPDGELAGVAEIPRDALAEGEIVATAYLGQTGDAGADAHAQGAGCAVEGIHLLRNPRAGADEGHVALEDVEQFRQFIERGGAQESAHEGGALLIRQEIAFRIAGVAHGAEFNDAERFLFASDTLLQEEGVATLEEHKQNQDEQQQGRNSKQQEECEEEVAGSLARAFVESAGRRQLVQKFYFFGDFHGSQILNFGFLILNVQVTCLRQTSGC